MLQCYICPSRCFFFFFWLFFIIAGASASLLEWYCEEETENCEQRGVGSDNCIPHARIKLASTTWAPQLRHVYSLYLTDITEKGVLRNHVGLCDRLTANNSEGSSPNYFLDNLNTLQIIWVSYCNIILADMFLKVVMLRDGKGLIW